ncbi:phospholipase A and acyltransferase 3-like [Hemiscyllium ocellatum]|uniref:phospholipase A and acyltransferase 3-like n=1 Tax=Hemiscyllium ocellatum TaxID=170820 RepID=UPI002966957B|nr:phospholipase A and acyltransferase 3-like [Hemiscyllium ocellatum]
MLLSAIAFFKLVQPLLMCKTKQPFPDHLPLPEALHLLLVLLQHGCDRLDLGKNLLNHSPKFQDGPPDSASVIASSSSAGYGVVKKERLIDVAGWNRYKVNNESDAKWKPLPVKKILKNAEAQVGKRRNYSVTTANCEHFVNELRYGKSVSYQVHHFGVLGIPAVAAAAVVGGAAVVGAVAVCSPAAAGAAVVGLIGYAIRALRF